jgi:hypothetical protein
MYNIASEVLIEQMKVGGKKYDDDGINQPLQ